MDVDKVVSRAGENVERLQPAGVQRAGMNRNGVVRQEANRISLARVENHVPHVAKRKALERQKKHEAVALAADFRPAVDLLGDVDGVAGARRDQRHIGEILD